MRQEDLLIRKCIFPIDKEKIEAFLSPGLNWAYIFNESLKQNVAPLLYYNLLEAKSIREKIPRDIWEKFERTYYSIAAYNTCLLEELQKVLKSLLESGIEVIVLKGMALVERVYRVLALRPMADIDLLVHEEDMPEVEARLDELGYENLTRGPEDFIKKIGGNFIVDIDIHSEILNITRVPSRRKSHRVNLERLWKNSQDTEIAGVEARILSPEDFLIDLCLHLVVHHGFEKLIWSADIFYVSNHYREVFDWNKFVKDALEYKVGKAGYYTLYYVKEILGAEVPVNVIKMLTPSKQNGLERRLFNLILSGQSIEQSRFLFTLSMIEGFGDQLKLLREIVLPRPSLLRARYDIPPLRSTYPYYLLHFTKSSFLAFKALRKVIA